MSVTVRWYGDQVSQRLQRAALTGVRQGTVMVHTRARQLVSRPAIRIRKRKHGHQTTTFRGSRPGQPPMLRTGNGRSNVAFEIDDHKLLGKVGVRQNGWYMATLELGTDKVPARPWLRPALEQTREAVETVIEARLRDALRGS